MGTIIDLNVKFLNSDSMLHLISSIEYAFSNENIVYCCVEYSHSYGLVIADMNFFSRSFKWCPLW